MLGTVQDLGGEPECSPALWLPDDNGDWALVPIEPPRRRLGF
jgi:hypothetical protein